MHDHVQPTELPVDPGDQCLDRRRLRQVDAQRVGALAALLECARQRLGFRLAQVGDQHLRGAGGELLDDPPADALGAAGDQHGLPAEVEAGHRPSSMRA
ncbi:hypothetical protein D9M71_553700 [compost metagenome]